MKSRATAMAFAVAGLAGGIAAAQAPQMPKPGPEVQKLAYFVGSWSGQGDMKESPFGPAGKMTSTENCSWFAGGFHVVCHSTGNGPMGEMKGMGVLGYNTEEKRYVYFGIDSMGMATSGKGSVDGETWAWSGEDKIGGKLIHSRYTMFVTSPTSYTFKWESSEDGKTWAATMEGKAAKQK